MGTCSTCGRKTQAGETCGVTISHEEFERLIDPDDPQVRERLHRVAFGWYEVDEDIAGRLLADILAALKATPPTGGNVSAPQIGVPVWRCPWITVAVVSYLEHPPKSGTAEPGVWFSRDPAVLASVRETIADVFEEWAQPVAVSRRSSLSLADAVLAVLGLVTPGGGS